MKTYTIFVPYEKKEDAFKYLKESEMLSETLQDEETREQFKAKIKISDSPWEGCDVLHIQLRSGYIGEGWYVQILSREEDEEEMTFFESKRLGARRGHMLRSMIAESETEDAEKKRVMEEELKQRLQWKKKIVKKILED
ncbi:hypothetical protein [Desulfobacterium sp. N47]|uniref:Uncharacterized protein n=1 Tax=uncultured Desulfobacterium sp. TaxID=201089 RepID=E1YIW3_9BACT|nr:unknown protein [uncultured Desulfobacterium sp.]